MSSIPYIKTATGLSFIYKGRSKIVPFDHLNFEKIYEAVQNGLTDILEDLFDLKKFIAKVTDGKVQISEDEVRVDGVKAPTYLAVRILENIQNNEPISAIARFTEKVMLNTNKEIVEDLFKWLEKGNMPIYADGDFVAYKKVRADYTAIHTGPDGKQMLQAIGTVVELPRDQCDENRDVTCSSGLHFCSYEYLGNFGTGGESKIIILKINPQDVVAIPTDYNLTKGRCCRFEVVGEVPEVDAAEVFGGRRVLESFGTYNSVVEENDNDNSWEEGTEEVTATSELEFRASSGVKYNASRIVSEVETHGPVQAAKNLGVARSTLYSWFNKSKVAKAA